MELYTILYQAGGNVYLSGVSDEKTLLSAIADIKALANSPSPGGDNLLLPLSLDIHRRRIAESRLDILFNNPGVSHLPQGSVSAQGHELQLATN